MKLYIRDARNIMRKIVGYIYSIYALLTFIMMMFLLFPFIVIASFFGKVRGGNMIYRICRFWADVVLLLWGIKHTNIFEAQKSNTRAQLNDAIEQRSALVNINPDVITTKILPGSYVKTNKGNFYISVALGKLIINGETVMPISPQSPLGAKLMGCCVDDTVTINANTFLVESIE